MAKANENIEKTEETSLSALLERIEKIEKENKELRKSKAADNAPAVKEPKNNPWNELVSITLFRDSERYKDDLFVGVNGRRYTIQRGVRVVLPRPVVEVIENSLEQEDKLNMLISQIADKEDNK